MKLNSPWLDWQPSSAKFEKCLDSEPAKTAEIDFAVFAGSPSTQNQNFFPLESPPELYEFSIGRWTRERCIFRDGAWGGLGALHRDYAVWAYKVDRDVPASFHAFTYLLRRAGFSLTSDGLICGLVLVEDLRAMQHWQSKPGLV